MLNNTGACCLALASAFGNKTAFPSSTPYASSLGSYFSHQEASVSPLCIVFPTTTDDVSIAIKTLTSISSRHDASPDTKTACQFAIRSGGHTSIAGAANIQGGVTLDLTNLDTIKLSPDQSIVSVGPGNSWDAVYSVLDGLNLSVAGGRTAGVGVGGLSLGGGISYLSTRYGWTSDTIINYELVLANGSIVSANAEQNPDLLWALRGGGNNFGVVTRVDLQTFEQEPFWGGYLYHTASFWEEEATQFDSINSAKAYDEYAHLTLTWGYSAAAGSIISNQVQYTKSPAVADPAIFQPLTESSPIFSSLGISNTSGFSTALAGQQVYGERSVPPRSTRIAARSPFFFEKSILDDCNLGLDRKGSQDHVRTLQC
ncbi:hypothetical protein FJTKL_12850 [Diaporthe vaccinii]|uniref:FAD-binding PCMH-type domain-containing protein n=1 Tax=Diaporthe vaccinii TaxID=105482 RepID=A0ABR4F9U2_9PEZI